MSESHIELRLRDAEATEALGAALARIYVTSGAGNAVVYLQGELGAGKTTCARSVLRALGVQGTIRSPTYTLLETYKTAAALCVHVDLYRLQGAAEVEDLGLRDYLAEPSLLLVEWPERGLGSLPGADIAATFAYRDEGRRCSLGGWSQRGRHWLADLAQDTSLSPYVSNLT